MGGDQSNTKPKPEVEEEKRNIQHPRFTNQKIIKGENEEEFI